MKYSRDKEIRKFASLGRLKVIENALFFDEKPCRISKNLSVTVDRRQFSLLRTLWLVAKGHIPKGYMVVRKNIRDKDISLDKLELNSYGELRLKEASQGIRPQGKTHWKSKLTQEQVKKIRQLRTEGYSYAYIHSLENMKNVGYSAIVKAGSGFHWKHFKY